MAKIVLTGNKGLIGSVVTPIFDGDEVVGLDLPEVDLRDYESWSPQVSGADALIHLAWNQEEHPWSGTIHPDNAVMAANVYRAALEHRVPKVILASSVHADDFYDYQAENGELLHPAREAVPTSPYGASKLFIEGLGRLLAKLGPEVVAVRLGGVRHDNEPDSNKADEAAVWLSHEDVAEAVKAIVDQPAQANRFSTFYVVSDTAERKHDVVNPFGWQPKSQIDEES